MAEQKPIPIRLSDETITRLDAAAKDMGSTRAGLVRLCTHTFLDHLEKHGLRGLPLNWQAMIEATDGRRSIAAESPSAPAPAPESTERRPVDYRADSKARRKKWRQQDSQA